MRRNASLLAAMFTAAAVLAGCGGSSDGGQSPAAEDVAWAMANCVESNGVQVAKWDLMVGQWNALTGAERDRWHAKSDGYGGFALWQADRYPNWRTEFKVPARCAELDAKYK